MFLSSDEWSSKYLHLFDGEFVLYLPYQGPEIVIKRLRNKDIKKYTKNILGFMMSLFA